MQRLSPYSYQVVLPVEEDECAICLEKCDQGLILGHQEVRQGFFNQLKRIFCQPSVVHKVHAKCINGWIETNGARGHVSCPSCRERIYVDVRNSPFLSPLAVDKLARQLFVAVIPYYMAPMGGWIVTSPISYQNRRIFTEMSTFYYVEDSSLNYRMDVSDVVI